MDRTKLVERLYHIGIWSCLVTALVLIFLLATSYRASAQWSTNPAAPMVVSNAANGNGGAVVFWETSTGDLYGARIYRIGLLYNNVSVNELDRSIRVTAFPNPAQGRITFQLPSGERIRSIELIDVLGAVTVAIPNGNTIATDGIAHGSYTVRIQTPKGVFA